MPTWALQLRSSELEPLGVLWHVPGVEASLHAGRVWLQGQEANDDTQRLLATLPCDGRFQILPKGELLRPGHRVPQGYLPSGRWQSLHEFLTVTLPPSSLPAGKIARVTVRLVPSTDSSEPNVLLTDLESWARYVASAPQIRLRPCQFAVSGDHRVLIHGTPLPPIAGTRAVARSGLVVPCGWNWTPGVEAALLAKAWGLEAGDLWLLWPGRPIERILAEQLVSASRSAMQQTREAVQHVRTE